jgi:hypothetical protein
VPSDIAGILRYQWLPWALFLLALLMAVVDLMVGMQNDGAGGGTPGLGERLLRVETILQPLTFVGVGAFILTRRTGNRIGRIMVALGLSFDFTGLMSDYPGQGLHGTRPLAPLAAWISNLDWTFPVALLLLLFLLFPTGDLPGRRWKYVLWIGLAACGADSLLAALRRGPASGTAISNPTGLAAIPDVILGVIGLFAAAALLGSLLALLLRFRSATGNVREQLKWFIYGAALALTFEVAAFASGWSSPLLAVLAVTATAALPVFMGVAILRYRLYDIDVLINRTLVYGSVTISLAGLYLGGVLGFQSLFRLVTGQGSDLAIAVTTLAVAALFNPWRHRLQTFIDRRFYRRKYDASRTLARLSARLRNDVDLLQLTDDIMATVHETVQPEHVSLWLR